MRRNGRAIARMIADGAPLIAEDRPMPAGQLEGWRVLIGGESFPAEIVWRPGSVIVHTWHPRCGPLDPGHETHGSAEELPAPANTPADVIAGALELFGSGWPVDWVASAVAPRRARRTSDVGRRTSDVGR